MKRIAILINEAKQGDDDSMIALIQRYEPLIIKLCSRKGRLDGDCRQHLTLEFLLAIRNFDLDRFK